MPFHRAGILAHNCGMVIDSAGMNPCNAKTLIDNVEMAAHSTRMDIY